MKCKECVHLAEDKTIYDKSWCLANNEDMFDKNQMCPIDVKNYEMRMKNG